MRWFGNIGYAGNLIPTEMTPSAHPDSSSEHDTIVVDINDARAPISGIPLPVEIAWLLRTARS